ncbi:MgtC/SapB family protein [Caulobacter segnis]|uniref:MgtC/SapB family protein n=1 Tax=Caulobacter segnis TaxID=88688 RepID=UPI00240FC648|nr:MgtC/SapB family protein [Caulobacter segnis]MDG2520924.1 MgtC/SapB family protein [Caulobacter segnis]
MDWWRPDLFFPILGAVAAGGLIGFEREFRGHAAGLRTHVLVCLASALLMLMAVHQLGWMKVSHPDEVVRIDPVRMAHGILTGVGFLCGGVIFRQGFSVHGLTTAASLWITSALGTLYGVGVYDLAITGTTVTLVVLSALRWVDRHVPQIQAVDVTVCSRRGQILSEADLRTILGRFSFATSAINHRFESDGVVQLSAVFKGVGPAPADAICQALLDDPRVTHFEVRPHRV